MDKTSCENILTWMLLGNAAKAEETGIWIYSLVMINTVNQVQCFAVQTKNTVFPQQKRKERNSPEQDVLSLTLKDNCAESGCGQVDLSFTFCHPGSFILVFLTKFLKPLFGCTVVSDLKYSTCILHYYFTFSCIFREVFIFRNFCFVGLNKCGFCSIEEKDQKAKTKKKKKHKCKPIKEVS